MQVIVFSFIQRSWSGNAVDASESQASDPDLELDADHNSGNELDVDHDSGNKNN